MQLTVALVAEEGAGLRALQLLADRGHRIAAVFTRSDRASGVASVASRARSLGVPIREASDIRGPAAADWMRAQGVELLLNVHSLYIANPNVTDAPTLGAYNLHPGPLPERAGLHTPSWALYEGADRYGVTLHRMAPDVDAGPIAFTDRFAITESDTGLTVMMQCVRRGLRLVERLLDTAERGGEIPAHEQDLARRQWYPAGPPEGGHLNWHNAARHITDYVRACDYRPFQSPWGFPRCRAGAVDVAIVAASAVGGSVAARAGTVARAEGGAVMVAANDAWVRVEEIELDGQVLAAADVLRGGGRLE